MYTVTPEIALMIEVAAEVTIDRLCYPDVDAGWKRFGSLIPTRAGADLIQMIPPGQWPLPTTEAEMRLLGYEASVVEATAMYQAIALDCESMSETAPDAAAELLALRAMRALRHAARQSRGDEVTTSIVADELADMARAAEVRGWAAEATPLAPPVCITCNDTHTMELRGRHVPCTFCPTPCQACRVGGNGAYCTTTPCGCDCHHGRMIPRPPAAQAARTSEEIARANVGKPIVDIRGPSERRTGVEALVVWSRNAGRAWPGYEIAAGPQAGVVFLASDRDAAIPLLGCRVSVTYTPADQFAQLST
jgi:hypothetical protein